MITDHTTLAEAIAYVRANPNDHTGNRNSAVVLFRQGDSGADRQALLGDTIKALEGQGYTRSESLMVKDDIAITCAVDAFRACNLFVQVAGGRPVYASGIDGALPLEDRPQV